MGQSRGRLTDGVLLGSRDTYGNQGTVSTSCKQFFTFREKGKEEELICGTDDSYRCFLPLNFLSSTEELHLN